MNDELILCVKLNDVPTKLVVKTKKPKIINNKVQHYVTHYLTANVFYNQGHWATRSRIVNYAKNYLLSNLPQIPALEKCRLKLTYYHDHTNFDLDNRAYFWIKVFLDLLKTHSKKEIINFKKNRVLLKNLNVLEDDTVKYIDAIEMIYKKGQTALKIEIYGKRKIK